MATHYKYVCRKCQKEHLQPVLQHAPSDTPILSCCGSSRKDMAFTSVVTPPGGGMSYVTNMLNAQADAIRSDP